MPSERPSYEQWLKMHNIRETPDYDVRGAYDAGLDPDPVTGHLDDTYKKTNHITYSDESRASKTKGAPPPGRWVGNDKDGWAFYASPTNIQNAGSVEALQDYFRRVEPGVKLVLPPVGRAAGGVIIDDGNPAKQRKLI